MDMNKVKQIGKRMTPEERANFFELILEIQDLEQKGAFDKVPVKDRLFETAQSVSSKTSDFFGGLKKRLPKVSVEFPERRLEEEVYEEDF